MWHLERRGDEVPVPVLCSEGPDRGWGLTDQFGKLFDKNDTRRSAICGYQGAHVYLSHTRKARVGCRPPRVRAPCRWLAD